MARVLTSKLTGFASVMVDNGSRGVPLKSIDLGMCFGDKWVLRNVDVTAMPGEIHGLVGHNGSGKSTLIKILAGYHQPAEGSVTLGDDVVSQGSPSRSYDLGLRFVHQDLGLVDEFSALENFGIGGHYSKSRWGSIHWGRQRDRLVGVLKTFGSNLAVDVPVKELSAVDRSLVAIARAVGGGSGQESETRFLVLDEPTTALEGPEVVQLFEVVHALADGGVGVIFVSHQLKDVLDLCGPVSVLRDGRLVETVNARTTTHDGLVRSMLGDSLTQVAGARHNANFPSTNASEPDVMKITDLSSELLRGIDLNLSTHECVCVLGLSGSGREDLVYAIAGAVNSTAGRVEIAGHVVPPLRPIDCRKNRIALVPGNRIRGSLVTDFNVRENLTFASLKDYRRRGRYIDSAAELRDTRTWLERFDVRPCDPDFSTRNLSGGNKQKVILAKWLSIDPIAMLIDEPTAGVDLGVARRIVEELRSLVDRGMSLLITTSEIDDAVMLADRVLILNEGRFTHEMRRSENDITESTILSAMTRGSDESSYGDPEGTE